MPTPVVSVITPVYNGRRFVAETIQSVLAQTFSDFEYIIVDDCSTDGSLDVITTIHDPRIRLIRHENNLGLVATRNHGAALANGKYLVFLDHDDLVARNRFEKQVALMEENQELGLVFTRERHIDKDGKVIGGGRKRHLDEGGWRSLLYFFNPITHSSAMVRRSALNSPVFDPEFRLCEDYWVFFRLAFGWGIQQIPENLTSYRIHGANFSKVALDSMRKHEEVLAAKALMDLNIELFSEDFKLFMDFGRKEMTPTNELHLRASKLLERLASSRSTASGLALSKSAISVVWYEYSFYCACLGARSIKRWYLTAKQLGLKPTMLQAMNISRKLVQVRVTGFIRRLAWDKST